MAGKIVVKNFSTLTDYAALLRAGLYLAGRHEEAEESGFRFKVMNNQNGVIVKVMESWSGKKGE